MANRLVRPSEAEYIPGQESVPSRPAYCTTVTKTVTYTSYITSTSAGEFLDSKVGDANYDYGVLRGGTELVQKTKEVTEEICYEAVEGQEGRDAEVVVDRGEDWKAGATSIESITDGGAFTFFLPENPRVLVGLAYEDTGPSFSDIAFGLMFRTQSGVKSVDLVIDGLIDESLVTYYEPGSRIILGRSEGRFFAYVGGEEVANEDAPHPVPVKLDALLYTIEDYVDDPEVTSVGTVLTDYVTSVSPAVYVGFTMQLSTETAASAKAGFFVQVNEVVDGEVVVKASGDLGYTPSVSNVTVRSQNSAVGYIDFGIVPRQFEQSNLLTAVPALQVLAGDYAYGGGAVVFPALYLDADGGSPDLGLQGMAEGLRPLYVTSSGATGVIGGGGLSLSAIQFIASEGTYGEASVSLGRMTMYADWGISEDPNFYGYSSEVIIGNFITTEPVVSLSYQDEVELESYGFTSTMVFSHSLVEDLRLETAVLTAYTLSDITTVEDIVLDSTVTALQVMYLSMMSNLDLMSTSSRKGHATLQYAFNTASGAATRYEGFNFSDFAHTDGRTFAVGEDGLYELDPLGSDNGQPISAMVDFGATSFGTSQRKHLETLYLGLDTDGQVYAKVYADGGKERIYKAIQPGPTRRVRTARGISAREWQVKLELVDVNEVDLSNVEFVVASSQRRWTR